MIRAIRPAAMAQDDASLITGWNVAPNLAYTLALLPGSSCGVLLYDEDGSTLVATGAALVGTAQPCVLIPQTGQTVGMVDADLGWHLLLTTTGTESQRTIRIGPAVDLPDEIHPVYGEDGLALARATAAIDAAAHYIDDVTVTCPLGLGAGLGDVVSVPVDGVEVVGQVESITWTATPDGAIETAVIRRHVAIAPEPVVEITPPTVADDTGTATHLVGTSGNVLANDTGTLTVVAVHGLSANVGAVVDGDNGGSFTIAADGAWTFTPDGDFALLEGAETANTSVTYHASDGTAEAMATLTVTVSHANTAPIAVGDTGETTADATTSGNVLTNDTDADSDSLTVSQVSGSASNVGVAVAGSNGGLFTIASNGSWTFDPDGAFAELEGEATATTSVTYHVSDGSAEAAGTLTVTVSAASAAPWTFAAITTGLWLDGADASTITVDVADVTAWSDKSGNSRNYSQATSAIRPTRVGYAVRFAADELICSVPMPKDAMTWFVVYKLNQLPPLGSFVCPLCFRYDASNRTEFLLMSLAGYKNVTFVNDKGGDANSAVGIDITLGTGLQIFNWHYNDGANTSVGSYAADINGAASTVQASGAVGIADAAISKIGNRIAQSFPAYMDVYEVVGIPGSYSLDIVQKAQGRLAHKWDALLGVTTLVDWLPLGHPYKSAPPML